MCYQDRHSIFCILSPNVLLNIARNGNNEEREFALRTLALDQNMRNNRLTFSLTGGLKVSHPAAALSPPQEKRTIYDAGHKQGLPGKLVRSEGQGAVADVAVNQAYDGLGDTFNLYLKAYDR